MTSIELLIQHIKSDIGKIRPTSDYSCGYKQALIDYENIIMDMLTELPQQEISDEEIEKVMQPMSGMHEFYKGGFIEGAKWYREQLKTKK